MSSEQKPKFVIGDRVLWPRTQSNLVWVVVGMPDPDRHPNDFPNEYHLKFPEDVGVERTEDHYAPESELEYAK